MTTWKVLKEDNGFNLYDEGDMSEWLLGNLTQAEANQLGHALLEATIDNTLEELRRDKERLISAANKLLSDLGTRYYNSAIELRNLIKSI